MTQSTASVTPRGFDYTYRFTGVTAIQTKLSLEVNAKEEEGVSIVNGARRLPPEITLSVIETDVNRSPGWAAGMLAAMDALRRNRTLCRLETRLGAWDNMLLAEISATQDEENQEGWSGDLTFIQTNTVSASLPAAAGDPRSQAEARALQAREAARRAGEAAALAAAKANNNASTRTNTGTAAANTISGAAVEQAFQRAGAEGGVLIKMMQ